jgi:hypothetical protein
LQAPRAVHATEAPADDHDLDRFHHCLASRHAVSP